jgi:hypothetical protein
VSRGARFGAFVVCWTLGGIVDAGLRQALRPSAWAVWALLAASSWWVVAAGVAWWPLRAADAVSAGLFSGVCLGPAILWVHGRHPRQLRRTRAVEDADDDEEGER